MTDSQQNKYSRLKERFQTIKAQNRALRVRLNNSEKNELEFRKHYFNLVAKVITMLANGEIHENNNPFKSIKKWGGG